MPYREMAPIARYPIRNSRAYPIALGLGVALMIAGPLVLSLAGPAGAVSALALVLTALPGAVVTIAYASSASAHIVGGGTGVILLYQSHLALPPPWGTKEIVFPIDAIHLRRMAVQGRIYGMQVSSVQVLEIRAHGRTRVLSSRMFDDPTMLDRLASDIERVRSGLSLEPPPQRAAPERDRYDEILDEELSKMQ